MRNKFLLLFFLISNFCIFLAHPISVFAEAGFKKGQPIEITADSLTYDKSKDTYHAEGNVVIIQDKSSIKADKATVDMTASHATAIGNVEAVSEEGNVLKGDSLELDIDAKVGVVINGRLFFKKGNVHVVGEEIRKTGDESYSAHKGFFTTCDCEEDESPAWGFYSSDADVTLGEYLTAWNSLFYVKQAPVFYFPYISFPVKRERETGFLPPQVGYSRLKGLKFDNSFFWAISDSTDATFYLDIESKRGIGEGIEYRYVLSKTADGEFYFYHFQENDINRVREFRKGSDNLSRPETATNDRWFLEYKHKQLLPYNVNLQTDIKRVSDDEYFIDFGKNTNDRSLASLESNLSLTKTWNTFNLVTQFRYFDNLLDATDATTLQSLPEIALTGRDRQIMSTPFHISMESAFVNFERKEGVTGQRLDIHPTLSLPLNPGGYFEIKPSVGGRETLYLAANNPPYDGYQNRSLYDLNLDITTTFVRIFAFEEGEDGLEKLKHTIRPKIMYTYIPEVNQDTLPQFDTVDNISRRNDITYSLNTILTGKSMEGGKPLYRNYISMDVSQSYGVDYEKYSINYTTGRLTGSDEKRHPFSDVTGEIKITPSAWTLITGTGQYDIYDSFLKQYSTSLGVWDKRGDQMDIGYRYVSSYYGSYTDGTVPQEYLEGSLRLKPVKAIDLTYRNRYSYIDKKTIETDYGLEYHHQCWGAQLTYTERLEEKIVMLTFNLLGIGQVGSVSERIE